jgi:hypothetical protein
MSDPGQTSEMTGQVVENAQASALLETSGQMPTLRRATLSGIADDMPVYESAFSEGVAKYLDHLRAQGLIESWRLTRRKLGLAPADLGDFHLMIEVKDLAQLDRAFDHVAERSEPTEGFHFGVNSERRLTPHGRAVDRRLERLADTPHRHIDPTDAIGRAGVQAFRKSASRSTANSRIRSAGVELSGFDDQSGG